MKFTRRTILLLFAVMTGFTLTAQDNIRNYTFGAGEVIDILLLNQNPKSDSIAKVYFKTAIPIAIENGYKPNKGFSIKDYPLQGNYHPQAMVIASWPSEKARGDCLVTLEQKVDQFHFMRRAIWTHFNVSYYPLEADLVFQVDMDRYNVATAYWENEGADMEEFVKKWEKKAKAMGGEVIINFQNGKSTFGYKYQPDYFIISSWKDQQQFESFKKKNLKMDHSATEQVHQFRIQ